MTGKKIRFTFLYITVFLVNILLVGCDNSNNKEKKAYESEKENTHKDIKNEEASSSPIENIKEDSKPKPTLEAKPTIEPKPDEKEALMAGDEIYIEVYKAKRILKLWEGQELIGEYPVGLGFEPVGHKKHEGDGKTPEGNYYVCVKNSQSKFYLSLGLSYPNIDDAKEALDADRISREEYESIKEAINNKTRPLWYTPLGGEIMIHGHGSESDWTQGCVAVENDIMDILWEKCQIGTQVFIYP